MNEQQLAAVKQALGALKKGTGWMEHGEIITALQSIISQDALDKKAENARELGLNYDDEPKIGCVNHDCDKCRAQEPSVKTWVGLTDEERDAITVMRTAKWRNRFRNHAKAVEQLLKEKNHDH
jgi:hypothetical protein